MVSVLDRYVVREVLASSLVALLVFTFTLEVQPLTAVAERLIQSGSSWAVTVRMMALTVPKALTLTLPMSLLCGILVALGRLSADSEYRAMQACGIGITRLLRPILTLGILVGLASAYVGFAVAPAAASAFRVMAFGEAAAGGAEFQPRVFVNASPNGTIFFREATKGVWKDVFIVDSSDAGRPAFYLARQGRLQIDRDNRILAIVLDDGTRYVAPPDKRDLYEVRAFRQTAVHLPWDSVFPSAWLARTTSEMSVGELRAAIAKSESYGRRAPAMSVELHQRFFVPVACVVLAVLGLGVGGSIAKTGKFGGFFVGIFIVFLCHLMMFIGRAMVLAGSAPVWLAMWYPIAMLVLAAGALLIWRVRGGVWAVVWFRPTPRTRRQLRFGERLLRRLSSSRFGWRTLDGYVVRLYLTVWVLMFLGLVSLSYASVFTDLLTDLLHSSNSAKLAVLYFAYEFPVVTYYVVPVATLLSALVTIGMLTKNDEVVAMKACGISLYRVAAPLLLMAGVIGVALLGIQEQLLPGSIRRSEAIREQIRGQPAWSFQKPSRSWVMGRGGTIYHFNGLDGQRGALRGLTIFEFFPGQWRLRRRTTVAEAINRPEPDDSAYEWAAKAGKVWNFPAADASALTSAFSQTRLRLEPIAYFKADRPEADRMPYFELKRYIEDLRIGGTNVVPYVVALYRKLSFPFVAIIMTLIAVPFGVTTGKRGAVHGIGVGAAVAFAYWTAMSMFGALGSAGAVIPILAAWAPNVLFGVGAIYLMLKTRT